MQVGFDRLFYLATQHVAVDCVAVAEEICNILDDVHGTDIGMTMIDKGDFKAKKEPLERQCLTGVHVVRGLAHQVAGKPRNAQRQQLMKVFDREFYGELHEMGKIYTFLPQFSSTVVIVDSKWEMQPMRFRMLAFTKSNLRPSTCVPMTTL